MFFIFRIFFSRYRKQHKMQEKHYHHPPPPNHPTFEIKNQNKGRGPYLLFGETTSHLTSKWRGTFEYPPPPPGNVFNFLTPTYFFLNVGNSIKRKHEILDKICIYFYFFQYFKNSYKIQTTFHQYQKLYSTPPWHGARICKVTRKYINAFSSYSVKTKRDRQMDRQMDGGGGGGGRWQYLPSWAFGVAGDKNVFKTQLNQNTNTLAIPNLIKRNMFQIP